MFDVLARYGQLFSLFLDSRAQPVVLVVLGLDDPGGGDGDDSLVAEGLQGLQLRLLEGVAPMSVVEVDHSEYILVKFQGDAKHRAQAELANASERLEGLL